MHRALRQFRVLSLKSPPRSVMLAEKAERRVKWKENAKVRMMASRRTEVEFGSCAGKSGREREPT